MVAIFNILIKRPDYGKNKDLTLKFNISNDVRKIDLVTDSTRLIQILSNLMNNAIKFTNQGFIEIGCKLIADKDQLEFYVKDTGIGIKEKYQEIIFERFRKVEEDKSQIHRGAGLGLAISSHLVKLLGGTICLESKYGKGSTFYFTIPLVLSENSPEFAFIDQESDTPPDLSPLQILVAEDDPSNYEYIENLLKKTKAKIHHASDGKEVLEILKTNPEIKLILMDIKMPVMDGIEALHEIRRMNIQIPVIAQTAYALADEVMRLKNEGFDDYLAKPIIAGSFYKLIKQFVDQTR